MSPVEHSALMVRDYGGRIDDYNELNLFIDSSKTHFPNWLHRAVSHNSWFVGICEKVFGAYIINSDKIEIPVRILAESHIKQDCNNKLPRIDEWLYAISNKDKLDWMDSPKKTDLDWLNKNHYKR